MPQIAQIVETYSSQIFWLLLVFGFIFVVFGRGMLPKIEATVDARDARIKGDLAAADAARAAADATEAAYRERISVARNAAQKAAAEAKSAAASATERRVKAADTDLAAKAAEADVGIAQATASALSGIEAVAAEAAQDIVQRISGLSVSPDEAAGAARAALAR